MTSYIFWAVCKSMNQGVEQGAVRMNKGVGIVSLLLFLMLYGREIS